MCLEIIDKNIFEVIMVDGFIDIDNDIFCVVLERDTFGIRECKFFVVVCRWLEAECVRRNLV